MADSESDREKPQVKQSFLQGKYTKQLLLPGLATIQEEGEQVSRGGRVEIAVPASATASQTKLHETPNIKLEPKTQQSLSGFIITASVQLISRT